MRALILALTAFLIPGLGYAAFDSTTTAHSASTPPSSIGPSSIGPSTVAWYDTGRASAAAPATPEVGVGPTDLLIQGLTVNTALLPISVPIPPFKEVTAFIALSFKLPDGATPASLTLHLKGTSTASIDSHLPSGVTPIACPATSAFKAGAEQPTSAAPKYDCSTRSTVGQLGAGGKTVTFPGISRLLTGNTGSVETLSVVILPGSLGVERLVFSKPGPDALSLLSFTTVPTSPLPTPSLTPPTTGVATPGNPSGPIPPVGTVPTTIVTTAPVPTSPEIASPQPSLDATAASAPDDHRERTFAIGMLVALLAAVAWLVVTEAGGRAAPAAAEFGVGRFRSARSGPPPTI